MKMSLAEAVDKVRSQKAERIITTLPSATEIVCLLGLEDKLVGITHECDFPSSVKTKPVVVRSVFDAQTMTSKEIDESVVDYLREGRSIYQIDETLLEKLKPDLVITQELCEVCATPLQLIAKSINRLDPKPKVLSLSPHTLEDVLDNVIEVGVAVGRLDEARKIAASLRERIERVRERCQKSKPSNSKPSVFCLEWLDPIYCSGHWMPELVDYAGGREVLGRAGEPSVAIGWEEVVEANPDVIFVTVCGYSIQRALSEISSLTERREWSTLEAVRNKQVYVLDGPSFYSRSGPRLVDGLEIMGYLLHPDLFSQYALPRNSVYSLCEARFVC